MTPEAQTADSRTIPVSALPAQTQRDFLWRPNTGIAWEDFNWMAARYFRDRADLHRSKQKQKSV